jgi:hypothetical protein
VLHTWGQTLIQHVHLHCLVPGGAYAADGRWRVVRSPYLFPVRALSRHFRGHFVAGLRQLARAGSFDRPRSPGSLDTLLDTLMATQWVVHAKLALDRAEIVIGYLARYTHRTALTDGRLVAREGTRIGLRYRDHRDHRTKTMWLEGEELVRRFLLHVLPEGFKRIRYYGLLASRFGALDEVRAAIEDDAAHDGEPQRTVVANDDEYPPCPRCITGRPYPIAPISPMRLDTG